MAVVHGFGDGVVAAVVDGDDGDWAQFWGLAPAPVSLGPVVLAVAV